MVEGLKHDGIGRNGVNGCDISPRILAVQREGGDFCQESKTQGLGFRVNLIRPEELGLN